MIIYFATKNSYDQLMEGEDVLLDDAHVWGSIKTSAGKVLDFCQASDNGSLVKGDAFYIVQAKVSSDDMCEALTSNIIGGHNPRFAIEVLEVMKQTKV